MAGKIIKRLGFAVLVGFLILGIGYGLAILIGNHYGYNLQDILFVEGIVLVALGLMMSMRGNPSGASLLGFGQQNATQVSNWNLEVTRIEREQTSYHRNFLKQAVLEFSLINVSILLGGILIILFSIFFAGSFTTP